MGVYSMCNSLALFLVINGAFTLFRVIHIPFEAV